MKFHNSLIAAAAVWLAVAGQADAAPTAAPVRAAVGSVASSTVPAGGATPSNAAAPTTPASAASFSQIPPGSISNTKNCGKGNNNNTGSGNGNQNNGNCPASP